MSLDNISQRAERDKFAREHPMGDKIRWVFEPVYAMQRTNDLIARGNNGGYNTGQDFRSAIFKFEVIREGLYFVGSLELLSQALSFFD